MGTVRSMYANDLAGVSGHTHDSKRTLDARHVILDGAVHDVRQKRRGERSNTLSRPAMRQRSPNSPHARVRVKHHDSSLIVVGT